MPPLKHEFKENNHQILQYYFSQEIPFPTETLQPQSHPNITFSKNVSNPDGILVPTVQLNLKI